MRKDWVTNKTLLLTVAGFLLTITTSFVMFAQIGQTVSMTLTAITVLILLASIGVGVKSYQSRQKSLDKKLLVTSIGVTVFCTLLLSYTITVTDFGKPSYGIIVEEQGIDEIKATPTYQRMVEKHGEENVTVQALDRQNKKVEYADDSHKEFKSPFMPRIDSQFKPTSGCIIIVRANGEGYVYQQDANFNIVHRITLEEFKEGAKNVDSETMNWFYNSLTTQ